MSGVTESKPQVLSNELSRAVKNASSNERHPGAMDGDIALKEGSYALCDLDAASLREVLASVPLEQVGEPVAGERISLPLPEGGLARLLAVESPVMDEQLASSIPTSKRTAHAA